MTAQGQSGAVTIDEASSRVVRAGALLAHGERAAARALLEPLARAGGPPARQALGLLAAMDESEGQPEAAMHRWQTVLADQIDDDEAWVHVHRLRRELETAGHAAPVVPAPTAAAPTLESGSGVRLSRFEIAGELGRGAFATVYRARDRRLGLELALKILHPRAGAADGGRADRAFFAEARRVSALRHPGIVAIYDIDEQMRTLAMELVPGGTLRERLRPAASIPGAPSALPTQELGQLACGLVEAVLHLHAADVVHGDLSPRNVLLRGPGEPVLIDFGGARAGGAIEQPAGTPLYLAPEQFKGAPASQAADLFAAGAVLWEAAAGRPMRTRDDLMAGRFAPLPAPREGLVSESDPERGPRARVLDLIEALLTTAPERRGEETQWSLARLRQG